ncbi:MAG: hypothetical protein UX09_C0003G0008 [Candidatus Uhrbacteria bacterium GW2011_GWE2_45_35]|uniref:Dockerin domain-containing protein n=2 Tax=Candidatus Uhriibacteriota TaxID=1752732 RepID=A0A0G1LPW2_9BACT|nr:MAG: hypothetical protein UW63_C0020G0010 [Candidatus Uhrbacteria bacterium GW2011_GWF2_44_350]KKU09134.1 MAG: hypothetical protein UX09_C0003G0008 [Candidatus Uhrbacteria bacterium GW2011_GWE2_45_35]HBR80556.1 hypothetical protein [Candidatus Uhrbacteria bacterium]HCU31457.1 hypothetical protein [Candidatus Uhrbacteria bacterium]
MFDEPNLPKMETPPGIKLKKGQPEIFVMPENFRGLAGRVSSPQVKPAALPPAVPAKPLLAPLPPKPVLPAKKKKMSKVTKVLLISGGVLFAVLAAAGIYVYLALQPVQQAVPTSVSTNAVKTEPKTSPTNTPVVENPETPESPDATSPFPTGTLPGRDTDSDGLTDAEELLYRTNSKKPDTDSDGFLDGNEVFHGYDPNAPSPARLNETALVANYLIEGFYSLDYPVAWNVQPEVGKLGNVLFIVPSGEAVSVSLEEKTIGASLAEWFSGTSPSTEIEVSVGTTKMGYSMLMTEDQMTVYVDFGERVVTMSYQNTVKATVDYLATFEMMMNTLLSVE